jgi:aerotaxis receptor
MRKNLPVLDREYPFPRGQTLVSTTDLKGRILYCNAPFVEVSGYDREDLLGQPHNMIRHPDMPEEAFRDMWETIQNGKPWSAPVKNRRKDGSYYWVMANVTPLMEGDRPTGYMSVRTEPERSQVQGAEQLYATMRAEKDRGVLVHTLRAGRLIKGDLFSRVKEALTPGMQAKVSLAAGVLILLGLGTRELTRGLGAGLTLLAMFVVVALGTVVASWYLRSLTVSPLHQLLAFANRMAAGDLSHKMDQQRYDLVGELTKALNQLNVNLQSIVRDARTEAEQMRAGTREIAEGNRNLSERTESQASNLEQTAASIEEMTGTVKQSAESAKQASQLAQEATGVTHRSSAAVHSVTQTMQAIRDSSKRISEITQLIDAIAFQTNILALNAAVEAARAGEQGRGFAVVASEVRALAHRTSMAAKEIKNLIEDSVGKVETGHMQAENAGATMQEALQTVERVNTLIGEISNAADEQLTGISQVNTAVAQLDSITQQNAALVEQIAASADALQGQAQTVTETVKVFRISAHESRETQDAVALRRSMHAQREAVEVDSPAPKTQPVLRLATQGRGAR